MLRKFKAWRLSSEPSVKVGSTGPSLDTKSDIITDAFASFLASSDWTTKA
jgi:hypothetical protein